LVAGTNPWVNTLPSNQVVDDAVSLSNSSFQTTWKKFGPYPLSVPVAGSYTVTLSTNNTAISLQPDPASWAHYDNLCIIPKQKADISIKKEVKGGILHEGAVENYTLTINNAGPGSSGAPTTITDTLPLGLTPDPSSFPSTQGNWTCNAVGQTITCTSNTPIPSGTSQQITLPVKVTAYKGLIENCASVKDPNDSTQDNNTSCVNTDVKPKPIDLAIQKKLVSPVVPATLTAGGTGTYSLAVTNPGGAITGGFVTVNDPMPAGLPNQRPLTTVRETSVVFISVLSHY
jgi:uncharacterized repeat protein (TIGR01451 family)